TARSRFRPQAALNRTRLTPLDYVPSRRAAAKACTSPMPPLPIYEHGAQQRGARVQRMLTARAARNASTVRETIDCSIMSTFALHSVPAETSKAFGDSLRDGSADKRRTREMTNSAVITAL